MKPRRLLLLSIAIVLIASCKLRIIVPEGGSVSSESGAYSCASGDTCNIDVVDFFFDETFTATAGNGYEFRFWKRGDRRFCGGDRKPCQVLTAGLEANEDLAGIMTSFFEAPDEIFYLQPVLRSTGEVTLPLTVDNLQGDWVGTAEISSTSFPDLSCKWSLDANISSTIAKINATIEVNNATGIDCASLRSEGRVSTLRGGTALLVDIYLNSASLVGPDLLEFIVSDNGEMRSEIVFDYRSFPITQRMTLRRP